MGSNRAKRLIGAAIGLIICVFCFITPPPAHEAMTAESMKVLGIFLCTIVWWITGVFTDTITGFFMMTAMVLLKAAPFAQVFGGFATSTWWMLWAAIVMGTGIANTGVLNRVALWVLTKFPPTAKGQTIGMFIVGLIINPLIPTANAKVGIVAPFAQAISDGMGFERKSSGAASIFGAFYLSVGCGYPLFTSASFQVYTMSALLPSGDVSQYLNWGWYFLNMIIWGLFLWVGGYFFLRLCFKPEKESVLTKEELRARYEALGPMRKEEKIAAGVLIFALIGYITNTLHGIDATYISLIAVCILMATNAMTTETFVKKVPWSMLMYMGTILGLTLVIPNSGIDKWIGSLLTPIFAPIVGRPALFLVVVCILIYVVRAFITSQTAVLTIFVVLLGSMVMNSNSGMAPFIAGMCVYLSMGVFYLFYMTTQYQTSYVMSDLINGKQGLKLAIFYMIINIVGILCSIPLWKATGFWTLGL